MMTSIANWWFGFITALLSPFNKAKLDRLKLEHAIEADKMTAQQRHIEFIMDSQRDLAETMQKAMQDSNSVLREWLEGFHKIPQAPIKAIPVNDDERMWRLEMQELAASHGKALADNMSAFDIEAFAREGFNNL
jgi:hypothetical protein